MNDFFADLEAQLRAAHGRRPSRTAHLARRAAIAASVALVAGVAVAVAIALSGGDARQAARPETFTVPAEHVPAPSREHAIAVLNGTRTPGFAGRIAPSLLGRDFAIAAVDDTDPVAHTRVLFRPGALDTALAAAARLHLRTVEELGGRSAPAGADVVVQVGPDAPPPATRITLSGPTAVLRPSRGSGPPQGLATTFLRQPGNRLFLHFRSGGLPRGTYGAWLVELHQKPHFLGYTPQRFPHGSLEFEAPLTVNAHRPNQLLLTRESGRRPTRPGKVVLQGQLRFP